MTSERMRRQLDRLLDEAEAAASADDWALVGNKARAVLALEPDNADALGFLRMAEANLGTAAPTSTPTPEAPAAPPAPPQPESFAAGRYHVVRFLGEGGKKRVFLAHDQLLDRDVAFSLIKTDGLDDTGRERIMREAQAMGRLAHPHIVSIYDIGEHEGQPYLVQELMSGGDVEALLAKESGALPLAQVLRVGDAVAQGLEYAHAQGVVHRDLKPGNVWLTADGVPKIGDFGLAVTLGRSRLTTHGMMVGTFQYMPPEQALGAEVTPRADLYSLGAMLYELITGRPPFQGETPTAVISQHLNAPPVAPSWYSDHCPPALEALILRLLAKLPADRLSSAAEVRTALAQVDPAGKSASHSDSQANPLDRLARGVFVGRERELEQLQAALDGALQGRGSVVMLVGEPGIGKTRTVQELETYARLRGAEVYWGRTHESSGMPAYWPWIQVGGAWGATHDVVARAAQGILPNPEMVRLFPDLRRLLPGLPAPSERTDESAQFLLFEAYTQFMRRESAETPWVVVLDDLHWADKPTLQLLQYVARELANMRVLVIGTYRDTDLSRTHPLSEALAELNRGTGFQRVLLRGLSRAEVGEYLRQRANVPVAEAVAARIFEETEGNPFFLAQVVNLMAEEGTLTRASVSEIALPDGVRETLGRRLDRLSEEANALLQVAAIAGREFAYDTLTLLGDREPDELLRLIEEALDARVIEELGSAGRYQFTHALMQETLLEELSTTRRVLLHGQVAEALERRWGVRADEYASRLALHFAESATLTADHAARAVHYLLHAARDAEERFAWAESQRLYTLATGLMERSEAEVEDIAAVFDALGRAAANAMDYRPAWRALMTALDRYRERKDWIAFADTACFIHRGWAPANQLRSLLNEAREGIGDAGPPLLRGRLAIGLLELSRFGDIAGLPDLLEAVRLAAEATGDALLTARLRGWESMRAYETATNLDAIAATLMQVTAALEERGALYQSLDAGYDLGQVLLSAGDVDASMSAYQTVTDKAGVWQMRYWEENAAGISAAIHLLRCSYAECEALCDRYRDSTSYVLPLRRVRLAELTGRFDEAIRLLPDSAYVRGLPGQVALIEGSRARVLFNAGRREDARRAFLAMDSALTALGYAPGTARNALANLGEVGPLLGGERLFPLALGAIPLVSGFAVPSVSWPRLRGDWLAAAERFGEAEQCYRRALDVCQRERAPIEEGLCLKGLAEVAERRGDIETARRHLDAAGELFAKYGAKLYLDQVIAKKEILKA